MATSEKELLLLDKLFQEHRKYAKPKSESISLKRLKEQFETYLDDSPGVFIVSDSVFFRQEKNLCRANKNVSFLVVVTNRRNQYGRGKLTKTANHFGIHGLNLKFVRKKQLLAVVDQLLEKQCFGKLEMMVEDLDNHMKLGLAGRRASNGGSIFIYIYMVQL